MCCFRGMFGINVRAQIFSIDPMRSGGAALLHDTDADGANADSAQGGDQQNDGTVHLSMEFYTAATVANGKFPSHGNVRAVRVRTLLFR